MVTSGADFRTTSRVLVNDHGMDVNEAFFLVTRAFRGGGFTKDFLYLRGCCANPSSSPGPLSSRI